MKNDGTYFLVILDPNGKITTTKPDLVYPFTWQGIELFVHRVYHCAELSILLGDKFWDVTVKDCGLCLKLKNITTIDEAKRVSIEILESKGLEVINHWIAKQRKDLNVILKV